MQPLPPQRYLTGITTSGTPHLGNYVGSIRPSVAASKGANAESFYFLADYHALIKTDDPARIQQSTLEIAASWLAAGLDPNRVTFYRQSDIPQIPELTWFLTCILGKGVLNRAHAYKAQIDKNTAAGVDADADVTAGLFMYPVLMGADILMFKAHKVPVGRDQIQHIEMARDMAKGFNHIYGDLLVLPEALIEESVATLPGLDGRKMSKSYDNTIALFSSRAELKKLIAGIVTDSTAPGLAKQTEGSALFQMYQAFASFEETAAMRRAFADGVAWGDAKQMLFERIDRDIAPMREAYQALLAAPEKIEEILQAGAQKATALSGPLMRELRHAVGLRKLVSSTPLMSSEQKPKAAKASLPSFKQYRQADGRFYFKFLAADGKLLLQSHGFVTPREAATTIAALHQQGVAGLPALQNKLQTLADVAISEVEAALLRMADNLKTNG
jgi:tryptophanyl-tRNA synthetase